MPSLELSLSFFGIALLLAYSPGPDNLFVLVQAATRGRWAGMCVVFGLCTGLLVHTAAVALGLAAVFAASSTAFTALKFAGAAYLLYLAWQAMRAPATDLPGQSGGRGLWRMYVRGIIMNLTNPKVVFFFLAFLPQFVREEAGPVALQLCWFGFLFMVATLLAFGSITWFAAPIGRRFQRSARAQRLLNRFAGLVFLGLALRLGLAER